MDKKDYKITSPLTEIELDKLHIQYIPIAKLENWYEAKDGYNMMALKNSPHMELLEVFDKYKLDWKKIKRTRYYQERQFRILTQTKWTKEKLIWHIKKRWKIFKSIKKHGFVPELSNDKLSVLVTKKPFWCTRFNEKFDGVGGFEIQNGAGRCATMLYMGKKTIQGYFIEDAKPGSKKWKVITQRFL